MAKHDLDLRMGIDEKLQAADIDIGALSYSVDKNNFYIDALKEDKIKSERQQIDANKSYGLKYPDEISYMMNRAPGSTLGQSAITFGLNCIAEGKSSLAEGELSTSKGQASHAEGYRTDAVGFYSHSEGYATQADGIYAHTEGYQTLSSGQGAHAEGEGTIALGNYSHAEGGNILKELYVSLHVIDSISVSINDYDASVLDINGYFSFGNKRIYIENIDVEQNIITLSDTFGVESGTINCYYYLMGEGKASGDYSHSEGLFTIASGKASHSFGNTTIAAGENSISCGLETEVNGENSIAIGNNTIIDGNNSLSLGFSNIIKGDNSLIGGYNNISLGNNILGFGKENKINGLNSFVQGNNSINYASNNILIGNGLISHSINALILGTYNKEEIPLSSLKTEYTTDENGNMIPTGGFSSGDSYMSETVGLVSKDVEVYTDYYIDENNKIQLIEHSKKIVTLTNSNNTSEEIAGFYKSSFDNGLVVYGNTTLSQDNWNQEFFDPLKFNNLFVIGNGTGEDNRSNAFTVNTKGDTYMAGNLTATNGYFSDTLNVANNITINDVNVITQTQLDTTKEEILTGVDQKISTFQTDIWAKGETPPENTKLLWIRTGVDYANGILYYYTGDTANEANYDGWIPMSAAYS